MIFVYGKDKLHYDQLRLADAGISSTCLAANQREGLVTQKCKGCQLTMYLYLTYSMYTIR